jgi:hypothetical protein
MGKHFGMNDDYWHGIIPLVGMPVLMVFCYFILFPNFPPNLQTFFSFIIPIAFWILLQYANEKIQGADSHVAEKYGSYQNFLDNSKKDWHYFWMGLVGGILISAFLMFII